MICVLSCNDDNEAKSGTILLSIKNECYAEVRLYNSSGKLIDFKDFDCQESEFLNFTVNHFGMLVFHVSNSSGKEIKKSVSILSGKIIEETVSF